MPVPARYRTGDYLIDLDAREIRRGGRVIDLEAKVFDLIALLLTGRDRALSKRELNEALWGDRAVTDAALSQQLRKARRALGDDGDTQAVIRTVHGRGLRWVAPVTVETAPEPAPEMSARPAPAPAIAEIQPDASTPPVAVRQTRRWIAATGLAVLLLVTAGVLLRNAIQADAGTTASRRIAILPIIDRTADSTLSWTRSGLMGLMASLFEKQGRIEVVPAKNVLAASTDGATLDASSLQALRRALGATHVVTAELSKLGPIYELNVHLVAAGGAERHESLHGSEPAPLAADAVARVARWLDLGPARTPDPNAIGASSPFLAEAYARGLDAQLHGDSVGAKKYFSICLDHDPGLTWPRLGLAAAQAHSGEAAQALENAGKVADAARERADIELLVPALRLLASLAFFRGDLDGSAILLDEAMTHVSAREHPLALVDLLVAYGSIDDERGDVVRSRQRFARALQLARESGDRRGEASVLVNLASLDNRAGDAAAAAASLRAGLDAARASGDAYLEGATLGNLGGTESNQGRLLAAVTLFKQGLALARARRDTNLQVLVSTQLAWALAPFGRDNVARQLAEQTLAAADHAQNPYWQAEAHALLAGLASRREEWSLALDELERGRALYAGIGMTPSVGEMLAQIVENAARSGDLARARRAADDLRKPAEGNPEAAQWKVWLPLIDAQLRSAGGDMTGASDDLVHALDAARGASGANAQASLFQLGRWQLALGRPADLLARPEWKTWLEQDPDAIALRVAALRASKRTQEADAEQERLDRLKLAPELDIDPRWLSTF